MEQLERGTASVAALTLIALLALLWGLEGGGPGRSWGTAASAEDGSPSERGALHLVFQGADCAESLASLRELGEMARARGLGVEGVALRDRLRPRMLADRWREQSFSFPVREESGSRIARELHFLGFRKTPVILVTDREGRVRAALPGNLNERRMTPTDVIDHAERLLDLTL